MKQAVYVVSTGRSGTVFLSQVLKKYLTNAVVYHERTGFPNFGVTTPDASHATGFNMVGNAPPIRKFWQQKLARDAEDERDWFVEISHFLAKAGLVENLDFILPLRHVHLIMLRRNPFDVAWSFMNRADFANNGFTWLFTLDPNYTNRIVDSVEFQKHGLYGNCIWYVNEVYARQAYYTKYCESLENLTIHHVQLEELANVDGMLNFLKQLTGADFANDGLPEKRNQQPKRRLDATMKQRMQKLFKHLWIDPDEIGLTYFQNLYELGKPRNARHGPLTREWLRLRS